MIWLIYLCRLFLCNSTNNFAKVALDRHYQEKMFDQVYDILQDSLDIQVTSEINGFVTNLIFSCVF